MYNNINSAPLSIKLALVTAAVGAGFAAPAQASVISTAPADFMPVNITGGTSYNLDIDGNKTFDYTIGSIGGLVITAAQTGNTITAEPSYITAAAYDDPSHFLSTSSMKTINTAFLDRSLTSTAPYFEVDFAGQNGVLTDGYIKGTVTADESTFTLLDFGVIADDTAVPEPGSLALLAAGAAGIGALRRRRRAASAV